MFAIAHKDLPSQLSNNFRHIPNSTLPMQHSRAASRHSLNDRWGGFMRKPVLVVVALGSLALAGCQTARGDRQLSGALIGGGTGALIGGVAGRTVGGALLGGAIGAVAGALVADATRPHTCAYRTRSGRLRYYRC